MNVISFYIVLILLPMLSKKQIVINIYFRCYLNKNPFYKGLNGDINPMVTCPLE